ncbi:MAG TPA: sugar transferase [Gammaproteobacteria bacterium]|nr:sugar transferase [Gammaproteobacteria bacterium]
MYKVVLKFPLDFVIAITILTLLSPALLLVAIAICLEDGGPALFKQVRVGKQLKPFTLFKFRSMPVDTENVSSINASDLKVTRVGAFIRRTNIDELPQLINIARGDMSIVGPRPALPSQANLIRMRTKRCVYECRPGLTGKAQINSYGGMPEEEKVERDAQYSASITLINDIAIIFQTLGYLLKRPPVY